MSTCDEVWQAGDDTLVRHGLPAHKALLELLRSKEHDLSGKASLHVKVAAAW